MSVLAYRDGSPLTRFRDEVNRLIEANNDETSGATANWVPAVDIHEYAERFALFVDLPGVDPSHADITLTGGVLTIAGERTTEKPLNRGERDVVTRLERGSGRFYRRFILPDSIDSDQIQATGRNGVLEISIPKQAKAQPRRIPVAA